MTSVNHQATAGECANCGSWRATPYCGECGQHERGSRRLRVRDVAANWTEAFFDVEAALPATLLGLIRSPGRVCRDYVQGRRKRYLNPFAFVLVALTGQIILSALFDAVGWSVDEPDELNALSDDILTWLLFLAVIPLAYLWTKLFRASGFNFAENYLLGLYIVGQVAWLELVTMPFFFLASSTMAAVLYLVAWLAVCVRTGVTFYSLPWYSVSWRMVVSSAVAFIGFGIVLGLIMKFFVQGTQPA